MVIRFFSVYVLMCLISSNIANTLWTFFYRTTEAASTYRGKIDQDAIRRYGGGGLTTIQPSPLSIALQFGFSFKDNTLLNTEQNDENFNLYNLIIERIILSHEITGTTPPKPLVPESKKIVAPPPLPKVTPLIPKQLFPKLVVKMEPSPKVIPLIPKQLFPKLVVKTEPSPKVTPLIPKQLFPEVVVPKKVVLMIPDAERTSRNINPMLVNLSAYLQRGTRLPIVYRYEHDDITDSAVVFVIRVPQQSSPPSYAYQMGQFQMRNSNVIIFMCVCTRILTLLTENSILVYLWREIVPLTRGGVSQQIAREQTSGLFGIEPAQPIIFQFEIDPVTNAPYPSSVNERDNYDIFVQVMMNVEGPPPSLPPPPPPPPTTTIPLETPIVVVRNEVALLIRGEERGDIFLREMAESLKKNLSPTFFYIGPVVIRYDDEPDIEGARMVLVLYEPKLEPPRPPIAYIEDLRKRNSSL